jgi:stress response protein YsnF
MDGDDHHTGATHTLRLGEEIVAGVRKRERETGRVRVSLRTDTVVQAVTGSLARTRVEVERTAIHRTLEPGESVPRPRHEADGTAVLPVLEEVLFVERRLVLVGEVRVRGRREEETVTETVALRRQRAEIGREPAA